LSFLIALFINFYSQIINPAFAITPTLLKNNQNIKEILLYGTKATLIV